MNTIETPVPGRSRFLWLLAGLFVALGLGYALLTPVFENSDETLHVPYVKHLADGRGLPLAAPGQLWNQEGTQPPLYYAIVAAATFWLNTDNLPQLLQPNPHWQFTEVRPLINDNQNLVLHSPADAPPYYGAALAVYLGRGLSLFFGLLTVIFTFLIARRLAPGNLPLAVSATALTALTPQFIRVSATVSNDSLSAALTTLAVLLALKFTDPAAGSARSLARPLLLGLITGLALLTKLSSLSTLLLVAFIIFWRQFFLGEAHHKPWRTLLRWLAVITGVTFLLTGWWFLRNYQFYGEWLATDIHLNLAGRGFITPAQVWSLRAEAERAYWATLGWGQIRPPEQVFQALFWFSRVGLVGLGLAVAVKLVQGDKNRPLPLNLAEINFEAIIILLLWAALNLALYLRWVMEVGSVSHTRLVFPAIAAISLLLALGWHALLPRRLGGWLSAAITALFLALNLFCLGGLLGPAFTPNRATLPAETANTINLTFLDSLRLERAHVAVQGREQAAAAPGDIILVGAQWRTLARMEKNYSLSVVVLAPDGAVLARRETYPGLGLRPTAALPPHTPFTDLYPLKFTVDIAEPMAAVVVISLFDLDTPERAGLPALNTAGQAVTPIAGRIKLTPRVWPNYRPRHPAQVNFNNTLALIGYDLDGSNLTLYWQALAPIDEEPAVFVHLLDAAGQVAAQADAPPTGGVYSTAFWQPGETIADRRTLPAAANAAALRLGLYRPTNGERWPIVASSLPQQDNSVEITLP